MLAGLLALTTVLAPSGDGRAADEYDRIAGFTTQMAKSAKDARTQTRQWVKDVVHSKQAAADFRAASEKLDSVIETAMADQKITDTELRTVQAAEAQFKKAFAVISRSLPAAYRSIDALEDTARGANADLKACVDLYAEEARAEKKLVTDFNKLVKKRKRYAK